MSSKYAQSDEYEMDEPLGFYVLLRMKKVKNVSNGGIITSINTSAEQDAVDIGEVVAIGPTAFHGYAGCIPSEYPTGDQRYNMEPHEIWGIKIGDEVGYRRYEGKMGEELYRAIPDSQIILKKRRKNNSPDSAIIGKVE